MLSRYRAAILLLSGILASSNVACSRISALWRSDEPSPPVAVSVTPSPAAKPVAKPQLAATPPSQPAIDAKEVYEQALDAGYGAATISQSAESPTDWQLVASRWQDAIALLRKIPSSSTLHKNAQSKIAQYQRNLSIAKQQATRSRPSSTARTTAITTAPTAGVQAIGSTSTQSGNASAPVAALPGVPEPGANTGSAQVIRVPIKRRAGRTPIIDVTFNGSQTFEMIVDTGASGTVITQVMANRLGVVPQGEVLADTASAKDIRFAIGKVQSMSVKGATVRDVPVAIGGPDLDLGLLGQDFYSNYDVLIRQNVVEFHAR